MVGVVESVMGPAAVEGRRLMEVAEVRMAPRGPTKVAGAVVQLPGAAVARARVLWRMAFGSLGVGVAFSR